MQAASDGDIIKEAKERDEKVSKERDQEQHCTFPRKGTQPKDETVQSPSVCSSQLSLACFTSVEHLLRLLFRIYTYDRVPPFPPPRTNRPNPMQGTDIFPHLDIQT
jgi:hypothetical protein